LLLPVFSGLASVPKEEGKKNYDDHQVEQTIPVKKIHSVMLVEGYRRQGITFKG
jgi:hypothetical protein